jgi:hypothetical protein
MATFKKTPTKVNMSQVFNNPQYRGKHVIVVGNEVYTARTGKKASQIIDKAHREHPDTTLRITYVPDADALIL